MCRYKKVFLWVIFLTITALFLFPFTSTVRANFRFVSWSDAQDYGIDSQNTAKKINSLTPNVTIFAGDLEVDGFAVSEMNTMIKAINGDISGSTSTGLFDKTFLVRGNHDNRLPLSLEGWSSYLNNQDKGVNFGIQNYIELHRSLTYSFDYENSRFIGIDVPETSFLTTAQVDWVDGRLKDAELYHPELVHAFIYFHVPLYYLGSLVMPLNKVQYFIQMTNKYRLVSAVFCGEMHQFSWSHIDNSKISGVTHEFEEFTNSGSSTDGFTVVDVNGLQFTVKHYIDNTGQSDWMQTFTKPGIYPSPTPCSLAGDTNGDCKVDISDLVTVLTNYGKALTNAVDQNHDGKVNVMDFAVVRIYIP